MQGSVAERGFFQNLEHGLSTACKTFGKLSGGKYVPLYNADIWAFTNLRFTLGHKLEDR